MSNSSYDAIVVGSGISGMAAAIILAKEGNRVLVLEQHSVPGGLTQTYSRKGMTFPTGVHRLGSLLPGQPLWHYFKYLDIYDRLELVPLAQDCFERFHFPDAAFDIPVGHRACREQMAAYFPDQLAGIRRYFEDMRTVISSIGMYDPSLVPEKDRSFEFLGSVRDYLDTIGITGRLRSLLTANSPLYGLSSEECPLLPHFIISV